MKRLVSQCNEEEAIRGCTGKRRLLTEPSDRSNIATTKATAIVPTTTCLVTKTSSEAAPEADKKPSIATESLLATGMRVATVARTEADGNPSRDLSSSDGDSEADYWRRRDPFLPRRLKPQPGRLTRPSYDRSTPTGILKDRLRTLQAVINWSPDMNKTIRQNLADLEVLNLDLQDTAGWLFEDEIIIYWLMHQLPKECDVVKDALLGRQVLERKDVIAVLQKKQELLRQEAANRAGDMSTQKCYNCDKMGHWARDCPRRKQGQEFWQEGSEIYLLRSIEPDREN